VREEKRRIKEWTLMMSKEVLSLTILMKEGEILEGAE
jgi:hypothetical protein